ncbi:MAG: glycosyltransferase family 9 protein [Deltaproteobacteria bacterium]|nr:glycosyltransferase family 9 protein [Deltaproteobacteria bacterium]
MIIHKDCRYFKGNIPCKPHKEKWVHCKGCRFYQRVKKRILIIKLDAVGDVLRTTSILHGLKEQHPDSYILWFTRKESVPLFENNDLVDCVLDYSAESFLRVQSESYDIVINPDADPKSAIIAESAKARSRIGFGYDARGYVYPLNKEAARWFEMGLFDDMKKANTRTYQEIVFAILGLKTKNREIILNLSDKEKRFAQEFARKNALQSGEMRIGLNTGAGRRWEKKQWTEEGFSRLIELMNKNIPNSRILLYGGPEEKERNARLKKKHGGPLIDTGCENTIREFFSLVDLADIFVTGDTLALHAVTALRKKVVALFGPTSHAEIDLYGRGRKIYADINCLCCYKQTCDISPSCMEQITAEMVFNAVKGLL